MTDPTATLLGESPVMERVREQIHCAALCQAPLLITGERGTGKELAARAVHDAGPRRGGALVVVDCAALSPTLAAAELFGHERGSFTGATGQRAGRLAEADGGTIFFDEVGHLALQTQAALLRFMEHGVFRRLGGKAELKVSTRIVAATNANLEEMAHAGDFLPDLLDRLNVLRIHLPPLRARQGDALLLARRLWQDEMDPAPAPRDALVQLAALPLPGNVRELRNHVIRLAAQTRYRQRQGRLAHGESLWDSDPITIGRPRP